MGLLRASGHLTGYLNRTVRKILIKVSRITVFVFIIRLLSAVFTWSTSIIVDQGGHFFEWIKRHISPNFFNRNNRLWKDVLVELRVVAWNKGSSLQWGFKCSKSFLALIHIAKSGAEKPCKLFYRFCQGILEYIITEAIFMKKLWKNYLQFFWIFFLKIFLTLIRDYKIYIFLTLGWLLQPSRSLEKGQQMVCLSVLSLGWATE